MRIARVLITVGLVADAALGSSWFTKAAYNKWHETELERWLSDHDIPYPTPADRKDLQNLVQESWAVYVLEPYKYWDSGELTAYLQSRGVEVKDSVQSNKDYLLSQVQSSWYETEDKAQQSWTSVKDWILDTWSESQLKAFCDYHGIPVPQPRKKDTLLQKARSNYDAVAKKAGEALSYPGNWLYETWSESELKDWLDTYGFPAPQPTTRDKLIASVRRNSRVAYLKMKYQAASAEARAEAAYTTLTDNIIDAWGESQLKEFCDKNGIKVPQGTKLNQLRALVRRHRAELFRDTFTDHIVDTWGESQLKEFCDKNGIQVPHGTKYNELRAIARRHRAELFRDTFTDHIIDTWGDSQLKQFCDKNGIKVPQGSKANDLKSILRRHKAELFGDTLTASAASAYGAATSKAGNDFAKATDGVSKAAQDAFDQAVDSWTESRLKAYLEARGVPVPHHTKKDELRALVRKHSHDAAVRWHYWGFDDYSYENLKNYLVTHGDAAAQKIASQAGATREELVNAAQSAYSSASSAGGQTFASATSFLAQATETAKKNVFDTWSESELKSYLDSYGVKVPQGSTVDELRAYARKQYTYFKYGTSTPSETLFAKVGENIKDGWQWVVDQIQGQVDTTKETVDKAKEKMNDEL